MPKSVTDRITYALDNLSQSQLIQFKHKLKEGDIIGFGLIENAIPVEIAHKLVGKFTESCAIDQTASVLKAINLLNEADKLVNGENGGNWRVPGPSGVSEDSTPSPSSSVGFLKEYDKIEPIGKGGFGRVFKARKKIEDKYVAVKIVKSKKKALREVSALSKLQHRNIVQYYHAWFEDKGYGQNSQSSSSTDSGSTAKYLYIQMELCERGTLSVWIDERNSEGNQEMRDKKALHIIQQVVDGVEYIHSKKLIHRDLKPLNIMFASDETVKIGDFGLVTSAAGDSDEAMERTKGTGTRSYMSPEQMYQCKYDKEVDIFALGLIYFEVLWRMPKEKYEYKLIERMLSETPKDRPDAKEIASELAEYCKLLSPQVVLAEFQPEVYDLK